MPEVKTVEDAEQIPDHHYNVGFNDYYETEEGEHVSVPDGTEVPDEWTLVSS